MSDFSLGFFAGFWVFLLFDVLVINFIYLSNIDLFLDLILLKKNKDKLIDYCKNKVD